MSRKSVSARAIFVRRDEAGIWRAFETNGAAIPLNKTGYKNRTVLMKALDRAYDVTATGHSVVGEHGFTIRLSDKVTDPRDAAFVSRMVDYDLSAEKALAAPPAAPVASDPVPADVPCYLAVSADAAGVETVLGVFRVADHASPQEAEAEASKLCDRIRAAAPLASYGTRWSNGKPEEPRVIEAATRAEFDTACGAAVAEHGREAPEHSCKGGVMEMRWPHVIVRWRFEPPAMVPQVSQQQQGRAAGPALEVDPVATARSYGFKIEPRAVFEAEPELPEGLRERAASYQGAWVFYDLEDNSDGFLLVGSDPEAIAADWYSGHGCDYEGAPVMRPVRMVPQLSQPQQGRAAPNGFYAFQARGERPEPARPMGPQERDGITPRTIQAQTVQVRTRAEWYAFHHACRQLARQRMISGRPGETFIPANICGRMHRLDVERLSIGHRVEAGRVVPVTHGTPVRLKASMISARPRRALIAAELDYAAHCRRNAAVEFRNGNRQRRTLAIRAARASIAEARSLATQFNRLP